MARAARAPKPEFPTETAERPVETLPPAGDERALYIVDLSGYVFRAYHAVAPLSNSKGEPTHAVMGTVNMLQKVLSDQRPAFVTVAMDSRTPTFRVAIDARYKAHRPPPPPDLSQQMTRCEEIVRALRIPVFQRDGFEADDLIAALTHRAVDARLRVVIVSADKDLMQLVHDDGTEVVLWDSMRDRVFGPQGVREKFGVPPSQVRDLLALTGDTSDNVPGVPGVGPKTAADLLARFGTLDALYARIEEVDRPKLRTTLEGAREDAFRSKELVTLKSDIDIAWDLDALRRQPADEEALRRIYGELELKRLLTHLPAPSALRRVRLPILNEQDLSRFLERARARGIVALDVETDSLDAMQARVVGVSLACEPAEGFYVPVGHQYLGVPPQVPWSTVARCLAPLFADPSVRKVGHNLKFDAVVLAEHGLEIADPVFDTMLATYLLDPETPSGLKDVALRELGVSMTTYDEVTRKTRGSQMNFADVPVDEATAYAAADAEITLSLHERFAPRLEREGMASLMEDVELPLSRVLERMERTGVCVDVGALGVLGQSVEAKLRELEAAARAIAGPDFSLRSRDQLERVLFDELCLPVVKRTPKGGRSTDAEVLEELADKHALPKVILEYRELDKLKGTYIEALPRFVHPRTGRIHTRFSQTTAATGRLASHDPNLQNIPIRTEFGRKIRAAFVAPPGHVIVSADYSQIELRVLAHLSKDEELLDAFRSGEDIHARTARLVFDVDAAGVTKELRRRAKAINFGVIYGMGDAALSKTLSISRSDAAAFIEAYFRKYAGVERFMREIVARARDGEAVTTLLGRRRFLPNLHSANRALRMEAERIARNTPIQGTAADILKVAMVTLGKNPPSPGARMVLTVHDELVFEVPESERDGAIERIRDAMAHAVALDVPLTVDAAWGPNWADAH